MKEFLNILQTKLLTKKNKKGERKWQKENLKEPNRT
jgi:hypothetical protein